MPPVCQRTYPFAAGHFARDEGLSSLVVDRDYPAVVITPTTFADDAK
jgi:hypothetical protein